MYRFLNMESFALFPRREDTAPALIVSKSDISWAARYPSWMKEVYTFGNDVYFTYPEGTLSEGEQRFKEISDDHDRHAAAAGDVIVKALKQKGLDKGRIGLDQKNIYPETLELIIQGLPHAQMLDKAGAAIIVCAIPDKAFNRNLEFAIIDSACASENILLAAEALGLGAVWTAVYPDKERIGAVRKELNIPGDIIPLNVIPIGYPTGEDKPKDKFKPENVRWNKF